MAFADGVYHDMKYYLEDISAFLGLRDPYFAVDFIEANINSIKQG